MSRNFRIFANSIAVLALAGVLAPAAANASPFGSVFHLHPQAAADNRVSFMIQNKANLFRDVKVGGNIYTVQPNHFLEIKAPAGTQIYAASLMLNHVRGSLLLEVTPALNNQKIAIY